MEKQQKFMHITFDDNDFVRAQSNLSVHDIPDVTIALVESLIVLLTKDGEVKNDEKTQALLESFDEAMRKTVSACVDDFRKRHGIDKREFKLQEVVKDE